MSISASDIQSIASLLKSLLDIIEGSMFLDQGAQLKTSTWQFQAQLFAPEYVYIYIYVNIWTYVPEKYVNDNIKT